MCILLYKANATFMNSKNRKTCDQYGLSFNFADKINLKRSDKYNVLVSIIHRKIYKNHIKTENLKYQ